ncbi:DUF4446 family protein [Candidatus Microgenomates bacterium]|nr:DUF4446 family protein [Candidatus Microgenomates bacterium]
MFNLDLQTLTIGLAVWLLGVSFFLYRNISHYNRLLGKGEKKNLKEILEKLLKEIEASKKEIQALKTKTAEIEKDALFHIQKIGFLKFNPFKNIGGEQSFILSLLDKKGSGVLVTSLHDRETTRWYVKMVKNGKGVNYQLSKEEKEVIRKANQYE